MSKSLSGYGLPMSMLMIRPELDQWKPGEHNGTFRGHNLAFVTATAAINHYWRDDAFEKEIARKGKIVEHLLSKIVEKYGDGNLTSRGRGLFRGLNCVSGEFAGKIVSEAFEQNLIIETSGANDQVVKCLCPLTVRDENLEKGLEIIEKSVARVLAKGSLVPDETNYFDDVVVNGDTVHAEA